MNDQNNTPGLAVLDLVPCLLLAVNVSRTGGESYQREDELHLEAQKDGEVRTQWTTRKTVDDEKELAEANSLQGKAKRAAGKLGRHTPVGIVVAASKRQAVEDYRDEWRAEFDEFNATAKHSRVDFSCMVFAIRGDNVQELEQVLDELRRGLDDLEKAYSTADPGSMRDVVRRMQGFTDLLPERVATTMELAVKSAQKRARNISKAERRVQRVQAAIAKELGPGAGPEQVQAELARISGEVLTNDLRARTARLAKLSGEADTAVDQLEQIRTQLDSSPIRLARFAVQRRVAAPTEEDATVDAQDLLAARLAGRVVGVAPRQDKEQLDGQR